VTASLLLRLINLLYILYSLAIVFRALLPRFGMDYYHPIMQFLLRITEPLLAPLRRYVPPFAGLDLTPMVALIVLWIVEQLLQVVLLTLL
jgi:YggT family protein